MLPLQNYDSNVFLCIYTHTHTLFIKLIVPIYLLKVEKEENKAIIIN